MLLLWLRQSIGTGQRLILLVLSLGEMSIVLHGLHHHVEKQCWLREVNGTIFIHVGLWVYRKRDVSGCVGTWQFSCLICLQTKRRWSRALPNLGFTLPSGALLVAAEYGHLERSLGGAGGLIWPFWSRNLLSGILFTRI